MAELLLYVYLFNLLFVALSLLQNDVRLYWTNIVQYVLVAALFGWMIYTQRTGEGYLWIATALFMLVVFVGRMVLQVASRLGYLGRFDLASWLAFCGLLLSWNSLNLFQFRFYRSMSLIRSGTFEDAYRSILKILEGVKSRAVRSVALSNVLLLLAMGRRWEEAVEAHVRFGGEGVLLPAPVWMHLVRAYSEVGRHEEALACQACLEGCDEVGKGMLFMGRIHLLALAGEVERVQRFFEETQHPEWPPCFRPFWEGRTYLAAGRVEEALEHLKEAKEKASEDPSWGQVIDGLIEQVRAEPIPIPVEAGDRFEEELLRLELREGQAWQQTNSAGNPLVHDLRWARSGRVTMGLILVNVFVFLAMTVAGGSEDFHLLLRFGALAPPLVDVGQWWRMVTCTFLHIGVLHVVLNMFGLYMMGNFLENLYGSGRLFLVYFGSGILASGISVSTGDYAVSAGASGAICGLLGGALAFGVKYRNDLHARLRNGLLYNLSLMVGLLVLLGFFFEGIDNAAHLGGTVVGFLLTGCLVAPKFRPEGSRIERWGVLVSLAGVVILTVLGLFQGTRNLAGGGYPQGTPLERIFLEEGGGQLEIPAHYTLVDPYHREQPVEHRLVSQMLQAAGGTVRWVGFKEPWPHDYLWGAVGVLGPRLDPESERTGRDRWVETIQSMIRQMPELKMGPTLPEEVEIQELHALEISFSYSLEARLKTGQILEWDRRVVLYFRVVSGGTHLIWFDLPVRVTDAYTPVMRGVVSSLRGKVGDR